jgi:multisubunit Na+/H+ antiporter MnhE subunit
VPAKLAKQTTATIITGIITAIIIIVVVEIITKKLLMTRLYKILKYRRVKPKNDG